MELIRIYPKPYSIYLRGAISVGVYTIIYGDARVQGLGCGEGSVKSLGRLYKGYRGLSREVRKMSHTRAHTLGRVALTFTYSGFRGLKVQGLRV